MSSRLGALAMLVAFGLLAGCTSAVDKSGSPSVTTLTVGYADSSPNANGQSVAGPVFLSELRRLFGDRLDLVEKGNLGGGAHGGDAATARAIANGEIDAGWVATRALSEAGIRGFDVLTAPMLLTSYAAERAVVQGEVAQAFLDQLDGSSLTGLSIAVGGLRHPVSSTDPLLGPEDWTGREVGVVAESQAAAFVDLGANPQPVETSMSNGFAQDFTAAEMDMANYDANLLAQQAPYVTANVVLWPKTWLFVVNAERLAGLSAEEQDWVRAAATAATAASVGESHEDNGRAVRQCEAGARFPSASASQVEALRAAFEPTLQRLAADPVDGPLLAEVRAVAAQFPEVEVLDVPERCSDEAPPVPAVGAIPTTKSDIPPGTYRMTLSEKDLLDAGVEPSRAAENDLVITLVLNPDGTYEQTGDDIDPVSPLFTNLLWEVGTYTGKGSTVYLVPDIERQRQLKSQGVKAAVDEEGTNLQPTPYSMTWGYANGSLTFGDVAGMTDPIGILWNIAHPYEKID